MNENIKAFLIGLEKLTRETGVEIRGCGCCGSPFLINAKITSDESGYAVDGDGECVQWIDPSDVFDWKEKSREIVK